MQGVAVEFWMQDEPNIQSRARRNIQLEHAMQFSKIFEGKSMIWSLNL